MKKLLVFLTGLGLVAGGVCAGLYMYVQALGNAPLINKSKYPLWQHTTFTKVVTDLVGEQPSWRISAFAYLNPEKTKVRSATYDLGATYNGRNLETLNEALSVLSNPKNALTTTVTLIPGRTWKQWKENIVATANITNDIAGKSDAEIIKLLKINPIPGDKKFNNLEGYFSPNSYKIAYNGSVSVALRVAHQALLKDLNQAWTSRDPRIDKYIKSPYELLILASLIEKEKGNDQEAPLISGVFINRFSKGMPLQTDPTIIYGLGDAYRGTIYKSDKEKNTPYNTYIHKGLTPTPIAMPSKASIEAAAHPANTDYIYFVAVYGEKRHDFSVNYADHQHKAAEYQKKLKEAKGK